MKIKFNIPKDKPLLLNLTDEWIKTYMEIGSVYTVFGLRFGKSSFYAYIFFDERHLVEVPLEIFEIVDDTISNLWRCRSWDNGDFTLWPELFYEEDFFEKFAEWETREREKFEILKKLESN